MRGSLAHGGRRRGGAASCPRALRARFDARERHVRPERPLLRLVEPRLLERARDRGLQRARACRPRRARSRANRRGARARNRSDRPPARERAAAACRGAEGGLGDPLARRASSCQPRKTSVTCSGSARTGRRSRRRATTTPSRQAASASRTSAGRSSATNMRARGPAQSSRLLLPAQEPPQQVHRHGRRAVADVRAAAGQQHGRARSESPVRRGSTQKHTVPTGFSSVPPPGPAIPVIATAVSAPKRASAPSAIAAATSGETAPWRSISSAIDAQQLGLGLVRVGDHPARDVGRGPGPLGQARRQQPGGARLGDRDAGGLRAARPPGRRPSSRRSENSSRGWRVADQLDQRRRRPRARRPARGADHDLHLAAAQAGRDLEAARSRRSPARPRAASRRSPTPAGRTAAACPGS